MCGTVNSRKTPARADLDARISEICSELYRLKMLPNVDWGHVAMLCQAADLIRSAAGR